MPLTEEQGGGGEKDGQSRWVPGGKSLPVLFFLSEVSCFVGYISFFLFLLDVVILSLLSDVFFLFFRP